MCWRNSPPVLAANQIALAFGLPWFYTMSMRTRLNKLLTFHPLLTLLVMFITVALFGLVSFNLFMQLKRNTALVTDYGWQALADGAFAEYMELSLYGMASLCFYILFKACEKILVERICK